MFWQTMVLAISVQTCRMSERLKAMDNRNVVTAIGRLIFLILGDLLRTFRSLDGPGITLGETEALAGHSPLMLRQQDCILKAKCYHGRGRIVQSFSFHQAIIPVPRQCWVVLRR